MVALTTKKRTFQNIGLIFLGIFIALIILEVGLRIGGFVLLTMQRNGNNIPGQGSTYRILALGESTTANLRNGGSSWPEELEAVLNNRSKNIKFTVFNEGIPSTTTTKILTSLEDNLDKYQPNMVITMMGTNDEGLNYSFSDKEKNILSLQDFRVYKLTKRIIVGLKYNFQRKEDTKETKEQYKTKEKILTEAVEMDPGNPDAWFDLEEFYDSHFEYDKIESVAEQHVLLLPNNYGTYYNLGLAYMNNKKYEEAKIIFLKVIELNQSDSATFNAYVQLGDIYSNQHKPENALKMYFNALQIYGKFDKELFVKLAESYREINKTNETYIILKKVLLEDPDLKREVWWFGETYEELDKTEEALSLFKGIIQKSPDNYAAYTELAWYYLKNNGTEEAENIFHTLEEMDSHFALFAYEEIGGRFLKYSKLNEYNEMLNRASEIRKNDYSITQRNYLKLYELTSKRNIKLVVMQYPTLEVNDLKSMFGGNESIIFVSNEDNFKKALENSSYDEYFIDSFRETFGHAAKKGNQLIAENAADEVLKAVENP